MLLTTLSAIVEIVRRETGSVLSSGGGVRGQVRFAAVLLRLLPMSDRDTAREELVMQVRMHGLGNAEPRSRAIDDELTAYADRHCRTYCGDQRLRDTGQSSRLPTTALRMPGFAVPTLAASGPGRPMGTESATHAPPHRRMF